MNMDAPKDNLDKQERPHQSIKEAQFDSAGKAIVPGEQKAKSSADTKILEDKYTLPHLEIDGQSTPNSSKAIIKPKDWTVAIDLASTLPGTSDKPKGWGAENQLEQLKQLAKQTEGKSVNFVVHAELPTDAKGRPCSNVPDDKAATCVNKAEDSGRAVTERFFIHDGKIETLPDGKYKDGAGGLKGLLDDAKKLAPADKLGIIIQSHGMGTDGIATNLGPVPLKNVVDSVSAGLKGSGHEKLDLLDFDSCDMGSAPVLGETEKVASDVVASAAAEGVGKSTDGQNLSTALQGLMNNTKMSGKDLGESIVNQAKAGANGQRGENSITTLANFDMSNFDDFKQSMDKFGTALSTSAIDLANAKSLMKDIDKTTIPESGAPEELSHNRDLKDFANNVLADIKAGKFAGDTEDLKSSATDFVKKFDSLATAQYGDPVSDYEKLGGLQTYMPGGEMYDTKFMSEQRNPLHKMSVLLKTENQDNLELSDKDAMVDMSAQSLKELDHQWAKAYPQEFRQIKDAQSAIEKASDLQGLRKSLSHLQEIADKIDAGPAGDDMRKHLLRWAKLDQKEFVKMPLPSFTPGWDGFLEAMRSNAD